MRSYRGYGQNRFGRVHFYRVVATLLVVASGQASGADVYWRPRMQAGVGHDSNVRMAYDTPNQKIEPSVLYQAQVDGELGIDSGSSKSTIFGRYWYQSVAVNDDYDADISQLRWNFSKNSERSLLTLDINVQYDTTLTSEFEDSGLPLNEKKDRHYFRNRAGYRWNLTERDYISGDIGADAVRYIDAERTGLNDYDSKSITGTYGRRVSETKNSGVQIVFSEFNIPDMRSDGGPFESSYETDNIIAMVFGDYSVSERDSLALQLGFRTSNFYEESQFRGMSYYKAKDEGNGSVYSGSYQHKFDKSSIQLLASRDLRPNGTGAVVVQDSVSVGAQHNLSERFSLNAGLSANKQRLPEKKDSSGTTRTAAYSRDFAQISAGLRYSVNEQNAVALEINGRWQRYDSVDNAEADSLAVLLRWYWTPPQKSM